MGDSTVVQAQGSRSESEDAVLGTYLQTITLDTGRTFRGAVLIAANGGVVATSSDYRNDTAVGTWASTGPDTMRLSIIDFTFESADGPYTGFLRITVEVKATGNTIEGPVSATRVHPDGSEEHFAGGTMTGQRIDASGFPLP